MNARLKPQNHVIQGTESSTLDGCQRIQHTRRILLFLPWIGLAFQALLAQSSSDLISAFLAASGSFLIIFDAFRPQRLYHYTFSTLALLGLGLTIHLGPLWLTALEGHSITFNLDLPVLTFGHGFMTILIAIIAHLLYRRIDLFKHVRFNITRLLIKLDFFAPLKFKEVVIMAIIGTLAAIIVPFAGREVNHGILVKTIQGFGFMTIMPFAFLLETIAYGKRQDDQSLHGLHLRTRSAAILSSFNVIILLIAGMLRNARGAFMVPFISFLIGYLLYWLCGAVRIRKITLVAFCLSLIIALPWLSNFSTAILMTRKARLDVSPLELLQMTLNQMQDQTALELAQKEMDYISLNSDLSEYYVGNQILARFANVRFPDNSLFQETRLSSADRIEMLDFHWKRLISFLPSPLLSLFGFSPQTKLEVLSMSFGDKLNILDTQRTYMIGWFRTGHYYGTGMAAFGYNYIFLLFIGFLFVFPLVDSHCLLKQRITYGIPIFSAASITLLYGWFTLSHSESVIQFLSYPFRGFIEPIVIFTLLRRVLRIL